MGRIRLATTTTNPPTLYAVVNRVSTSGLLGLWKSSDRGTTWAPTANPDSAGTDSQNTWYNLDVATFPTDGSLVYVLAQEVLKTINGGLSWTNVSQSQTPPFKIHVDQHAFGLRAGQSERLLSGQRRRYVSFPGRRQQLRQSECHAGDRAVYRGAAHPTDTASAFGGTQDNGSLSYQGNSSWYRADVADGGYAAIDYFNPNIVYATQQQLTIDKSTTGPRGAFSAADSGIPPPASEPRQFIAPLVMDPTTPQVLYAGTNRVYRTANTAGSWTPISPVLSQGTDSFSAISAIAVSRSAPGTLRRHRLQRLAGRALGHHEHRRQLGAARRRPAQPLDHRRRSPPDRS